MSIVKIVVIGLVLAVLVTLVEEVQTRTILLGLLGFPLRSSRNNLEELLALKLVPHPMFPRPTRRTRKKLFLVMQ